MPPETLLEPPIRALIADDEPLARGFLRRLLDETGGFAVVAEAADGREALAALRLQAPDVAFLDIRMPHLDGIEAARNAASDKTLFVFVTAYDQHAVRAFEAGGVDYLLKPVARDRFGQVVDKVRRDVRRRRIELLFDSDAAGAAAAATSDPLRLRVGAEIRFLRADDIVWIEAANQYVNIYTLSGAPILASESLAAFHKMLDTRQFVRVHRSAVVNRAHVDSIRTDGAGGVFLVMDGGARIGVSRRFRAALARVAPMKHGG